MRSNTIGKPSYDALMYFFRRYKKQFLAIFLLTLVSSAVDSFSVVAFFPMFSSLLSNSQEGTGVVLGFVTGLVDFLPFSNPIVAASVFLILVFLAKTMITLSRVMLIAHAAAGVHYDVKKNTIERYANAQYQFILDNQQGALTYNTLEAPPSVTGVLHTGSNMAASLLKTIAITSLLFSILPFAALALLGMAVAYYALMHYLSKKVSFRLGAQKAVADIGLRIITNEFLTGFRQIVTQNSTKWWTSQFDRDSKVIRYVEVRQAAWFEVPRPIMELSGMLLLLGLILIVWITNSGGISDSLPTVGVFGVALVQLMPPLTSFGTLRLKLMSTLPNLQLVHQTLAGPVPARNEGTKDLPTFENAIVFEDVGFDYKGRESLFSGLNMTFNKGEVTAIVGSSGAGKTTIVNLLLGLFEPTGGRITVDGIPLQDVKRDDWLNKIGFVSQEPFTYHATVADNILLGRDWKSRESVVSAAKIANAHEFIVQLPQGYDTLVGERGMKLSGGQQQRLAIARALLDSPEILIFDEATSNLDSISERLVQEAIDSLSTNRTVIVIAHRLTTIRNADKIIVLENGRLVEMGDHQELLRKNGQYARLAGFPG